MLELANILLDIDALGRMQAETQNGMACQLSAAENAISDICKDPDAARARLNAAKTSWLTADFTELPSHTESLPAVPEKFTVVASDGSQIVPDKNQVALCYLLNASSIVLPYGTGARPEARSIPRLCYKDEDLFERYENKKVPVTDKFLAIRRTLAESEAMEYAISRADTGSPVVALWDGSLIHWSIENEPADYKERVLSQLFRLFDLAQERRIPIAGYISDPGSRDFTNTLKVMLCDAAHVNCDNCPHQDEETKPCNKVDRLKDSSVLKKRLLGGKRSVLFTSCSKILNNYRQHKILAFYMDIGSEIVRVEVPEWVAEDPEMLSLTHAVCYDQAQKGRGYPVALTEAHEHAVVRGPERAAFYQAIEHSCIKHGARIQRSRKRISKNY